MTTIAPICVTADAKDYLIALLAKHLHHADDNTKRHLKDCNWKVHEKGNFRLCYYHNIEFRT